MFPQGGGGRVEVYSDRCITIITIIIITIIIITTVIVITIITTTDDDIWTLKQKSCIET